MGVLILTHRDAGTARSLRLHRETPDLEVWGTLMKNMHDQPPGWYRDPVRPNRHRYWSGHGWIGPVGENLVLRAQVSDGPVAISRADCR